MRKRRKESFGESEDHHHEVVIEPTYQENVDEILELAWMVNEEGGDSISDLASRAGADFEASFDSAAEMGLIGKADGRFELPPEGRERAKQIIRRHRLTEVLLSQILEMEESHIESDACRFEHILSPETTDSICTLLGHPPTCPHGKLIPRGQCCEILRKEISPLVRPLSEVSPGEMTRIVFITPKSHARLDRLASLGIVPGRRVKLHQKRPTCVIKIGETDVAIDLSVAGEIFVKRV